MTALKISIERAREACGVVIDAGDGSVSVDAAPAGERRRALRARQAQERRS